MLRKLFTLLAVLVACASATVSAQSSSSTSNPVSLTITPFLSCSPIRGIDFGTARRSDGQLFTSATNYAEWQCDTDPGASANFTFSLPSAMINPSATGLTVPLSYGNQSAHVDANGVTFDPSAGLSSDIVTSGHAVIRLGYPFQAGPSGLVRADVSNASSIGGGHYSATITLNVTLNAQ